MAAYYLQSKGQKFIVVFETLLKYVAKFLSF